MPTKAKRHPLAVFKSLYVQVLSAIALGIVIGHFAPETGVAMKPLGDGFIKLIKMMIGPIIFCTVVGGIASMGSMREAGSIGLKAMLYFFVMTLFCLAIGLAVAHIFEPGSGMNIDPATLDQSAVLAYTGGAPKTSSMTEFMLHIIPRTAVDAFASGEILQVLFFALLFAGAATALGAKGKPVVKFVEDISHFFFAIIGFIMKLAPIGAFGAMAYTVGEYGVESLSSLLKLLLTFYLTCFLFVFIVLAAVLRWAGFSIIHYLAYIKEEIFIVLGTCSSETVFPRMVDKLEALGVARPVVGMVLPTGYSFNLDGTAIALTLSAMFLAQATNTEVTFGQQLLLLGVMMLTSKGAAGVVGTAFVVLTATLASLDIIPVAAVAIILGVDRFMSEGRAVTNLIGNGIATIVMAKWEGKLDTAQAKRILSGRSKPKLETTTD